MIWRAIHSAVGLVVTLNQRDLGDQSVEFRHVINWRGFRYTQDVTMQPAPQNIQLMSKHRVLGLKP